YVISPGYFATLHVPIIQGRDFTEQDGEDPEHKTAWISGRPISTPVMIVNQAFVRRFLGAGAPLGREVWGWGTWFKIVGVVKDSKYNLLTEPEVPYFYVPFRQVYRADMALAFYVRATGNLNDA